MNTHGTGSLSVTYVLDLRKLNFLQKLNAHHTSVMNLLFSLTACKEFDVIQPQAYGRLHACVWQAFVCHLSGFFRLIFYCILCTLPVHIVLLLSVVFYTVLCELRLIYNKHYYPGQHNPVAGGRHSWQHCWLLMRVRSLEKTWTCRPWSVPHTPGCLCALSTRRTCNKRSRENQRKRLQTFVFRK